MIAIIQFVFVEVVLHEAVDVHCLLTQSSLSATSLISRRGKLDLTKIKSILHHVVFLLRILRERFMTQKPCRVVNSGHLFELAYLLERLRLHLTVISMYSRSVFSVLLIGRSVNAIITTSVCLSHCYSGLCGSWLPVEKLVFLIKCLEFFWRSIERLAVLPCKLHIKLDIIRTLRLYRPLGVHFRTRSGALTPWINNVIE